MTIFSRLANAETMKKAFVKVLLISVVLISCQRPREQNYYQDSPEIDLGKKMIDAYLSGNWDVFPDFYADTARIWRNRSWMTDAGMSPQQLIVDLQKDLEPISEYSMDHQNWEMIVNPEGDRWVHYRAVWHGTLEATGRTYDIPVQSTMKVANNKIVLQIEISNEAELAMDMMALATEAYDGSTLSQPRVHLTSKQLHESTIPSILHMSYFAKPEWAREATNHFSGTINFVDTEIITRPSFSDIGWDGKGQKLFPSFSVDFVSDGDVLIPRNKGIISTWQNSESFWDYRCGKSLE
jgi:hypothetical protein